MTNIIFDKVSKDYQMGEVTIHAANQVSFHVESGELCIILGPSGAGKSTVLNLLGGMEKATSGKILFVGNDITAMDDAKLTDYRRYEIGFIFQFYNLIPILPRLKMWNLQNRYVNHRWNRKKPCESWG